MWTAFISGVALSGSLIIALGAQNVFVLRQGLQREFVPLVVWTCALIDACLLAAGVFGVSRLARLHADVLAVYGAMAAWRAIWPVRSAALSARPGTRSLALVWGQTLAVSLLNPHVYLDTVFLVGAVGAQYPMPPRALFWGGAACMSTLWFVALGFGARWLTPVFARPQAWRWLDGFMALTMWGLAIALLSGGAS
jgi:L-lysine exporter family protein LysE/ArgO